jgi:predicted secreted Zn-dependent protease
VRVLAVSALLWSLVPHVGVHTPQRDLCDVSIDRREYLVQGVSSEEIRRSMLRSGPRDGAGNPRFAATEWTVEWRWKQGAKGDVDADSISLSCRATMLLPRYVPEGEESQEVAAKWLDFARRLERHEYNHLEHVRRIAPEIRDRILRADRRSGGLSPAQANRIAHRVVREMRSLDEAYDRETNHGRTEGVWSLD